MNLASLANKIQKASDALQSEAEEARRAVGNQEERALAFCCRLLAIVRVALEDSKGALPNSGWRAVIVSLLTKVVSTLRAAHTLGVAGHSREVGILVRSALETFITAAFIAKEDSDRRARRWAKYAELQKARVLRKYPDLSSTPEDQKMRDEILVRAEQFEEHFPSKNFWASGLQQGSVRDLAEEVGMGWYYDMPYWSGSQATHGSAIAIGSYLSVASDGNLQYKMGLSSEHLRGELAVCCDLLVRTLAVLNETCELGLDEICGDLVPEYKAAFGDAPPRIGSAS